MSVAVLDERPTWHEVVLSFAPPQKRTSRAVTLLARLPIWLILIGQAVLTWRLSDIANDDEALYIDAGHDILSHAIMGSHVAGYGSYFSGAPAGYPVVAAALDSVGGLVLVRLFSLACLLVCTVCVQRSSQHLFGRRAGLFSALVFALSGSVLFVGKLATYDAPCIALIALAMTWAITRRSVVSGAGIGILLALAATTKYAGAAFIPVILAMCFLSASATTVRDYLRPTARSVVAAIVVVGVLLGGFHLWGASIRPGLSFTTTGRKALDYQPMVVLLRSLVDDIGLVVVLALVALVLLSGQRAWRKVLVSLVCLVGGLLLPLSQIRIHEFTSLDKHTAFSALFLAVPAGLALASIFTMRGSIKVAAAVVIWLLLIDGLWRSETQYSWPSTLMKALAVVDANPVPGTYVSIDGDAARYYWALDPHIRWESSSFAHSLFDQGTPVVISAIRSRQFSGFVYQTGDFTAARQREQATVTKYFAQDPDYRLAARFRVSPYGTSEWYVWQKWTGTTNVRRVPSVARTTQHAYAVAESAAIAPGALHG